MTRNDESAPVTPQPFPEERFTRTGDASPTDAQDEQIYYEGSPRLRGELGLLAVWGGVGLLLIVSPFLVYLARAEWPVWWLTGLLVSAGLLTIALPAMLVRRERYRVTNYRIDFERGLLGKRIDTLELWHVDDLRFRQSPLARLMRVGTIVIDSDDRSTPNLTLRSLPRSRPLFEQLKQRVIAVKRQRGVIKMDMGGGGFGR